ncbi:MAG TPA: helix-turn-helix domain-containing protein, partial [Thermomonas sp.]|uniref:TetR/AcrR family transcriptional regulator n=1 Tax=Thermomonas sp. TaxID=1971895 RepID=UPI002CE8C415
MASPAPATKPALPGRPKDMAKRAAILEAASKLFVQHGFSGVSMDQIAAEAGVSKLTVYSHFGDKDGLFIAAVRAHCEQGMPTNLFEPDPNQPLRERLTTIAHAFLAMVMAPEAIAGHRVLCSPQVADSSLSTMIWDAGPKR